MTDSGGGKSKSKRFHGASKPYERRQSFLGSLTDTVKSVVTPSWLTDLVRTVKRSSKSEESPTEEKSREEKEIFSSNSSNLKPKTAEYGQLPNNSVLPRTDTFRGFTSGSPVSQNNYTFEDVRKKNESMNVYPSNVSRYKEEPAQVRELVSAEVLQNGGEGEMEHSMEPPSVKLNQTATWTAEYNTKMSRKPAVWKTPGFDVTLFGTSEERRRNTGRDSYHMSPFYSGKTCFGGALTQKSRMNRTAPDLKYPCPVRQKIQPKTNSQESTSTAKRILATLQKMSTPLNDARKIPFEDTVLFDSQTPIAPRGPPRRQLTTPLAASVTKNRQRIRLKETEPAKCQEELPTETKSNFVSDSSYSAGGKLKEKKFSQHISKRGNFYDEEVELPNLRTEFTLPIDNIIGMKFGILDKENGNKDKGQRNAMDGVFTFSSPVQKGDILNTTSPVPKMLHKTEATLLEKNNMLNKAQMDLDFIQSAHTASEEKCHTEMTKLHWEERNLILSDQCSRLKEENRNIEARRNQLEQENGRLNNEIADQIRKLSVVEANYQNLDQTKRGMEEEKMRLHMEIEKYREKSNHEREKCIEAQSKYNTVEDQLRRIQEREETNSQKLLNSSANMEAVNKSKSELEESYQNLKLENAKLGAEVKHERQRVEMLQKDLNDSQKVRNSLEALCSNLKTTNSHLEDKLGEENTTKSLIAQEAEEHKDLWEKEVISRSKLGLKISQYEKQKQDAFVQLEEERRKHRKTIEAKRTAEMKLEAEIDKNTQLQKEVASLKTYLKVAKKRLKHLKKDRLLENEVEDLPVEPEKEEPFPELTDEMLQVVNKALPPADEVLVEGYKLQIRRRDLESLAGLNSLRRKDNWLNDEIINFYMNQLVERGEGDGKPKVYAFNTHFYPKVMSQGHDSVRRWTKGVDIFSKDYILIPVHLVKHWCLAVIDFKKKMIRYFDSMGGNNMGCLNALKEYLCAESLDKKKQKFDLSEWKTEITKEIPQQMNGSDCGMFTCKFAEYITREADINFTQKHMPYFRKRMVYEIVKKKLLQ